LSSQRQALRLGDAEIRSLVDAMSIFLSVTLPQPADKIDGLQSLFRRLTSLRSLEIIEKDEEGSPATPGLLWALHAASPAHAAGIERLAVQFQHSGQQHLDAGLTASIATVLTGLKVRTL
jgi:hypothetical protein